MSELLLKGATMTNRHCDTCGDPIFRYEGQEFCPTCQSRELEAAETADSPEQSDEAGAPGETPSAVEREESAAPSPTEGASDRETLADARAEPTRPDAAPAPRPDANGQTPSDVEATPARQRGGTGDLSDARASLVRALSTHATAAESASDPRVARDHLAAAREAAEALRALDGR